MSHINSDTASPHSDGMRRNEGASAEGLRHVRDWLDRFVCPIATIEQRDELDRYSYEWREARDIMSGKTEADTFDSAAAMFAALDE